MPVIPMMMMVVLVLFSSAVQAQEDRRWGEGGRIGINFYTGIGSRIRPKLDKCGRDHCAFFKEGAAFDGNVLGIKADDSVTPAEGKRKPSGEIPEAVERDYATGDPPEWYKNKYPKSTWPDFNNWTPGNPGSGEWVAEVGYTTVGSDVVPASKTSLKLTVPPYNTEAYFRFPSRSLWGGQGEAVGNVHTFINANIYLEPKDRYRSSWSWGYTEFHLKMRDTGSFTIAKTGPFAYRDTQLQPLEGVAAVRYVRLGTFNTISTQDLSFVLHFRIPSESRAASRRAGYIDWGHWWKDSGGAEFTGDYHPDSTMSESFNNKHYYDENMQGVATGKIDWTDTLIYFLPEISGISLPPPAIHRGKYKIPFYFSTRLTARIAHAGYTFSDFTSTSIIESFRIFDAEGKELTDQFHITNDEGVALFAGNIQQKEDYGWLVPIMDMLLED